MFLPERGDYVTSTFLVKPIVNLAICIPSNDINMLRTLKKVLNISNVYNSEN